MKYYIYTLSCPITNEVRYVGKSTNPSKRFSNHLCDKSKSHKASWIKSLISNNKLPVLNIVEEFDNELDCYNAEIAYISKYDNLTNHHIGGLGATTETTIGSLNGNSKITEDIVLLIKDDLLYTDLSILEISEKYAISKAIVQNITSGSSWAHITNFTGKEKFIRKNSVNNRKNALINAGVYDKLSVSVEQYDLEMNLLNTYKSITEASKQTGVNRTSISQCINNKLNKTKDYIWKRNVK